MTIDQDVAGFIAPGGKVDGEEWCGDGGDSMGGFFLRIHQLHNSS